MFPAITTIRELVTLVIVLLRTALQSEQAGEKLFEQTLDHGC